jgi:acetyl-CoA C-acetyltransferase
MTRVFIAAGVRTAVGTFGGSFKDTPAVGCTGAMNTVKLAYELVRTGERYGLVTMCIGGGQGIAAILERV